MFRRCLARMEVRKPPKPRRCLRNFPSPKTKRRGDDPAALPLPARWRSGFSPQNQTLHVDFSDDAADGQSPEAQIIIGALRKATS